MQQTVDTPVLDKPFNLDNILVGRDTDNTTRLFVYGTLKSDGSRHDVFQKYAGTKLLNTNVLASGYTMEATTMYPIVYRFPLHSDSYVKGELWEIPTHMLIELDYIEGVATGLYTRIWDREVQAWMYVSRQVLFELDSNINEGLIDFITTYRCEHGVVYEWDNTAWLEFIKELQELEGRV